MIRFEGASVREGEDGKEYTPRGAIWINPTTITAVYEHTILINGNRIHVMEGLHEILSKLNNAGGVT